MIIPLSFFRSNPLVPFWTCATACFLLLRVIAVPPPRDHVLIYNWVKRRICRRLAQDPFPQDRLIRLLNLQEDFIRAAHTPLPRSFRRAAQALAVFVTREAKRQSAAYLDSVIR